MKVLRPIPALALAAALATVTAGCHGSPDGGGSARDWSAHPGVVTIKGAEEIDVLGDPHGDPDATFHVLAAAGLITTTTPLAWQGGTKILVVTGDVIDKGSSALPIIDLLIALEPEARAAGGRVVVTLGNHEAEFLASPSDAKTAVFQAELRAAGLDAAAVDEGAEPSGSSLLDLPHSALIVGGFYGSSADLY